MTKKNECSPTKSCSTDERTVQLDNRQRGPKPRILTLIGGFELLVRGASDDAGFSDGLISEDDELVLGERGTRSPFLSDYISPLGKGLRWRSMGPHSSTAPRILSRILNHARKKFTQTVKRQNFAIDLSLISKTSTPLR